MINDYFIKIEKYWFDENVSLYDKYGEYGLLLYCSILQGKTIRDYCKFNIHEDIYRLLRYNSNSNRTQITKFNSIFSEMIKDNVFEAYDLDGVKMDGNIKLTNNTINIYINDNVVNIPNDKSILFFSVLDDNYRKILNYRTKDVNTIKLFSYYCYIAYITNVGDGSDFAKKSMDFISVTTRLSKGTIINYNHILSEDLNLIKHCPSGFNKKDLKEGSNIYCMVEYFENAKHKMKEKYGDFDTLKLQKNERDIKRSIKLNENK